MLLPPFLFALYIYVKKAVDFSVGMLNTVVIWFAPSAHLCTPRHA